MSRAFLGWIAVILVAIVALLALSFFVPAIGAEAARLAGRFGSGKIWIVVAGLAAPIVYAAKALGSWVEKLAGGLLKSEKEREIEARADRIEAELRRLGAQVAEIDADRRRALDAEHEKIGAIDGRLGELRASRDDVYARAEAAETAPRRVETDEEVFERLRTGSQYLDLRDRPAGAGWNPWPHGAPDGGDT
ncbi:MAG TPA: hypothetical protein VIW03_03985 [Anaeromyxobacter sp.]